MPAKLTSRLPLIAAELKPRIDAVVAESMQNIAQSASQRAPRGATGELARTYEGDKRGVHALWRYHFSEFGTRHSAARPHLIPALEEEVPRLILKGNAVLRSL